MPWCRGGKVAGSDAYGGVHNRLRVGVSRCGGRLLWWGGCVRCFVSDCNSTTNSATTQPVRGLRNGSDALRLMEKLARIGDERRKAGGGVS